MASVWKAIPLEAENTFVAIKRFEAEKPLDPYVIQLLATEFLSMTIRHPNLLMLPDTPTIEVDLYFDRSVLEVFFGKGALSFSLRAYLSEAPFVVQLTAAGAVGVMSATISPFE